MSQSNDVSLQYIQNEIYHKYEKRPQDVQDQLVFICDQYLKQKINFEEAKNHFLAIDPDISLLLKLQHIVQIEQEPLPSQQTDNKISSFTSSTKVGTNGYRKKSSPWTNIEDLRLVAAVFKYGAKDWKLIAEFVGNDRSSSQCNQRWCRAIDPSISHSPWSQVEDQQLLHAVEVLGSKNWCQVAKILKRRTDLQCRYRYQQLLKTAKSEESPLDKNPIPGSISSTYNCYHDHSLDSDDAINLDPPSVSPIPQQQPTQLNIIASQRRNSITIAPFIMPNIQKPFPSKRVNIPYYLDSSMMKTTPKNDFPMLHRLPPLIFERTQRELI